MKLIIIHYHLRPSGVRRIIELAVPPLVAGAREPVTQVILATGEAASAEWHEAFVRSLRPVPVTTAVEPSFHYWSGQNAPAREVSARIRRALQELLAEGRCTVWMHNPALGRNPLLTREVEQACAQRDVPLIAHHHDWWFDNRWPRWKEIREAGFRSLAAAAKTAFPTRGRTVHAAINQADARILGAHCGARSVWLPNLTIPGSLPPVRRVAAARRWLDDQFALRGAPFWLVPCRTLRRKNLAEALLLARWLRPEGWLLVTGGASSPDEEPYDRALRQAIGENGWPMRLGILAASPPGKPDVADLLGACEAVLFTSLQEGFGLPYLEAAAARRPLIARRLPNVMPDLARFGFQFPQAYDEVRVAPGLFDWQAERARQARAFREWRASMPAAVRKLAANPAILAASSPAPVAFSRLTLQAQLEVLSKPASESWTACHPLNPFLATWRRRAAENSLRVTPWPAQAGDWLGAGAYARRFHEAVALASRPAGQPLPAAALQAAFIRDRLAAANLYPLLWPAQE